MKFFKAKKEKPDKVEKTKTKGTFILYFIDRVYKGSLPWEHCVNEGS